MRKLGCLLIVFSLLISCEKADPIVPTPNNPVSFVGSWRWFKTRRFFHPDDTPLNTGQNFQILIKPDSTFSRSGNFWLLKNQMVDSLGTYGVVFYNDCSYPPNYFPGLLFRSNNRDRLGGIYKLNNSGDTLKIDTGECIDAPVHWFVRF